MSLLVTLEMDVNTLPAPTERDPGPEEILSGTPHFRTWLQDQSLDGRVRTGIWEATPGLTHAIKTDVYEYCLILEGLVEIGEKDGETYSYGPGDSFLFKPGFVGTWKTIETVRKVFISAR